MHNNSQIKEMEVDSGGKWNIVDNTCNGNTWSPFTNKHWENLSIYIFRTIQALNTNVLSEIKKYNSIKRLCQPTTNYTLVHYFTSKRAEI